jgi:hypothetical protein
MGFISTSDQKTVDNPKRREGEMESSKEKEQNEANASAGRGTGTNRLRRRVPAVAVLIAAVTLSIPVAASSAAAPARPSVTTGGPQAVSYASAILTGHVNPHGRDTSYYFQYGLTKQYGGQTAIADAGAGTHAVSVRLPIEGLQPLTVYHYRLVAVSSAGATIGGDKTVLTHKVPLSLQILLAPDPVSYGGTTILQGTLSGTENGNRVVVLQQAVFPAFAFFNVGNAELTSATGGFSFPVLGLTQGTEFRVVTTTSPPVVSPVAWENVTVNVEAHVGRSRRAHHVRVFGTVTPAESGMQVAVMKIVHGGSRLAAGGTLHPRNASSSQFSIAVPRRRGVYQVLVRVTNGAQMSNYSSPLVVR